MEAKSGHQKFLSTFGLYALSLTLLLLSPTNTHAQDYGVQIATIYDKDGVGIASTFGIVEDTLGFMWFATVDGLYRYDGYELQIYRNNNGSANSLSNNTLRGIDIDSKNRLWIATQGGGLNSYDINNQQFTRYRCCKDSNSISNNDVWSVMVDDQDIVWFGMSNQLLNSLDTKTGEITEYQIEAISTGIAGKSTIRSLAQDKEGGIWMGTDNHGAFRLDPVTQKINHYFHKQDQKNSIANNSIYSIASTQSGHVWMTTYGRGIIQFRPEDQTFHTLKQIWGGKSPLISELNYTIQPLTDSIFLVGTEYGITALNLKTKKSENYTTESRQGDGLIDDRIRAIYKDSKGLLWVGTEAGVNKIVKQNNFKRYSYAADQTNSLPDGIVRAILKDSTSKLWIGLIDNGLVRYDIKTGKFTLMLGQNLGVGSAICTQISTICETKDGLFLIGDWENGVFTFDRQTQTFKHFVSAYKGKTRISDNRIQFIIEADKNVLWIGTETGLNLYNYKTGKMRYFLHNENDINTLGGNALQTNAFVRQKNGDIWLGTWAAGISHIQFTDSSYFGGYKITRYKAIPDNSNSLSTNNVIALRLQHDSILWIGTFGGGLNKLNIQTQQILHYTVEDGLPNNVIFAIQTDNSDRLWLSTDNGISRFNPKNEIFRNFDKSDGLQDDHFFWGSSFKAPDGEIFYGGINGLNSFYPNKVELNTQIPACYFTDFRVYNKSIKRSLPFHRFTEVVLPHDSNFISIGFAILDFDEPAKNKARVKLDGLETGWNQIGNRRQVDYTNLAPGQYTFKVLYSNSDGFWAHDPLQLSIIIKPPWWKTPLAMILFLLLTITLIIIAYRLRLRALQRSNKLLERMVAARTQELQQQKEELANTVNMLSDTQQQLVRAEKMASLGTLVAGIAHEINNPVNYIYNGWQIMEGFVKQMFNMLDAYFRTDPKQREKHLPHMHRLEEEVDYPYIKSGYKDIEQSINLGIKRTTDIIKSLNSYARTKDDERVPYKLQEAVENALLILHNKYKNTIQIQRNFHDVPPVLGNPGQLNQLFVNIISNAVDAISGEGQISISIYTDNNQVCTKFTDTGCGIPDSVLTKVFDPFFTTKEVGKGTGLGLYIAYQVVENHGATIKFNSTVNQGTTVLICFPQVHENPLPVHL